ncbi:MAG: GlsB/YeaQ/YmgE family stress response membrane protein [Acidimicrobiia bacterium]|nr:GlsB/YeaQ/YmgE family stress response membrane protein [Acidimicrobiia bacterium]
MLGNLVSMVVWGLIAGVVARAIVPGKDQMSWWQTTLLGIAGSFVGGTLGVLFSGRTFSNFEMSGVIGSIIGAVIALIALRMYRKNNS